MTTNPYTKAAQGIQNSGGVDKGTRKKGDIKSTCQEKTSRHPWAGERRWLTRMTGKNFRKGIVQRASENLHLIGSRLWQGEVILGVEYPIDEEQIKRGNFARETRVCQGNTGA